MKTTIEVSDDLLEQARQTAARDGTTVHALVELGLRRVVEQRQRMHAFKLCDGIFGDHRLQPQAEHFGWPQWRDLAHEGRGS